MRFEQLHAGQIALHAHGDGDARFAADQKGFVADVDGGAAGLDQRDRRVLAAVAAGNDAGTPAASLKLLDERDGDGSLAGAAHVDVPDDDDGNGQVIGHRSFTAGAARSHVGQGKRGKKPRYRTADGPLPVGPGFKTGAKSHAFASRMHGVCSDWGKNRLKAGRSE